MKILYYIIHFFCFYLLLLVLSGSRVVAQERYYPPAGQEWEEKPAGELGFNNTGLEQAVSFALESENSGH